MSRRRTGTQVAYQVIGDRPLDLVYLTGITADPRSRYPGPPKLRHRSDRRREDPGLPRRRRASRTVTAMKAKMTATIVNTMAIPHRVIRGEHEHLLLRCSTSDGDAILVGLPRANRAGHICRSRAHCASAVSGGWSESHHRAESGIIRVCRTRSVVYHVARANGARGDEPHRATQRRKSRFSASSTLAAANSAARTRCFTGHCRALRLSSPWESSSARSSASSGSTPSLPIRVLAEKARERAICVRDEQGRCGALDR